MKPSFIALIAIFVPRAMFAAAPGDDVAKNVQPLVAKYCGDCHSDDGDTEFRIDLLGDLRRMRGDKRLVAKIVSQLENHKMPPPDELQPSADERRRLLEYVKTASTPDPSRPDEIEPGRVVMRRLSRYEYANTVRDLFQMSKPTWRFTAPPGTEFPEGGVEYSKRTYNLPWNLPPDEVDYGFDNIGDVLTMSPYLMESYFEVGGLVIDRVAADSVPDKSVPDKSVPDATQDDKARRIKILPIRPTAMRCEEAAARENLAVLAERAFRRPVTGAEVQPLVDLFHLAAQERSDIRQGDANSVAGVVGVARFSVSRRTGRGCRRRSAASQRLRTRQPVVVFPLEQHARCRVVSLAREKRLTDPAMIETQVRRMLLDPRAESLAEHFAPLWLQIDDIQAVMPDPTLYSAFYRRFLGGEMRTEAIMLFDSLIARDRSILDLVDARHDVRQRKIGRVLRAHQEGSQQVRRLRFLA